MHTPIAQRLTVTAVVLSSMVEMIKLTPKSPVHLLRAVALGVGTLHPTTCALELGQLPTAKWVRLLSHLLRVGSLKQTLTPVLSQVRLLSQRLGVGSLKETLITAASRYRLLSQRLGAGSLKSTPVFGLGNREVSFALSALRLSSKSPLQPPATTTRSFISQPTGPKSVSVSPH